MDAVIEKVGAVLNDRPEPLAAVWVFGSRARGTARPSSDLDLALLYSGEVPRTLLALPLELKDAVERATRLEVDIAILNHAEADLVHRVLRDGVLVLERDRAARVAFEVQRRAEYFDLEPHLRRYRRVAPR